MSYVPPVTGSGSAKAMTAEAQADGINAAIAAAVATETSRALVVEADLSAQIAALPRPTMEVAGSVLATGLAAVTFTSVPDWAERITILFGALSVATSAGVVVQLGSSAGVETTGYVSFGAVTHGSTVATATTSTGFAIYDDARGVGLDLSGRLTLSRSTGNTWIMDGLCADNDNTASVYTLAGRKTLGGVLDRIRIQTANGADLFSAGRITLNYE